MPIKILEKLKAGVKEGEIDEEIKSRFWHREEGQIVSGYIGPEFGDAWEQLLPDGITKDMVYIVSSQNKREWYLQSRYIRSQKTIDKFSAKELDWLEGGQPEEGRRDPRKQEVGAEEESQEEDELRPAA